MTELDAPADPQVLPEEIVHWQPVHQRLGLNLNAVDGPVVATAVAGVLAMVGLAAGAYLIGRMSVRR